MNNDVKKSLKQLDRSVDKLLRIFEVGFAEDVVENSVVKSVEKHSDIKGFSKSKITNLKIDSYKEESK